MSGRVRMPCPSAACFHADKTPPMHVPMHALPSPISAAAMSRSSHPWQNTRGLPITVHWLVSKPGRLHECAGLRSEPDLARFLTYLPTGEDGMDPWDLLVSRTTENGSGGTAWLHLLPQGLVCQELVVPKDTIARVIQTLPLIASRYDDTCEFSLEITP